MPCGSALRKENTNQQRFEMASCWRRPSIVRVFGGDFDPAQKEGSKIDQLVLLSGKRFFFRP